MDRMQQADDTAGTLSRTGGLLRSVSGQSLVELAAAMPLMVLLLAYAVNFGYYFIVAAGVTSVTRDATNYASAGYQSAGQTTLPAAGPMNNVATVSGEAASGLVGFANSGTTTAIQVCSKQNGVANNLAKCTSYGVAGTAYTPAADPEAPTFILQQVDVTYTLDPPIKMGLFGATLMPSLTFHRQVAMRAED